MNRFPRPREILSLLACLAGLGVAPAQALEMEFFDGDVNVNISHSLSYGINVGIEETSRQIIYGGEVLPAVVSGDPPDCGLDTQAARFNGNRLACGNGGLNSSPNEDAGHLAFKRGTYANQFKGVTDVKAVWGEFTAFTRLLYFYDWEIMNQSRENFVSEHYENAGLDPQAYGQAKRVKFSDEAEEAIGADIDYLDLYVAWDSFVVDHPVTVRVGDQVINWGQSTFLPGIAITNPVNLNRLFSPGFELRELYKPVGLVFGSFGISENLAVEAYYQYRNEPVVLPPGGSFFAVNNYTGAGPLDNGLGRVCLDGSPTNLGFHDDIPGDGDANGDAVEDFGSLGGLCVNTSKTLNPGNGGEFGLRFQVTLPWLNYTQLDFYAIRYHSRLPHVGANRAGIVPNAGDAVCASLTNLAGLAPGTTNCPSVSNLVRTNPELFPDVRVAYAEDLWAYGFSFSSNIPGGWTMQGEVSLKKDMPMQYSLPTLIDVAAWIDLATPATDPGGLLGAAGLGTNQNFRCSLRQLDLTGFCGNNTGEAKYEDSGAGAANLNAVVTTGDINLNHGIGCNPATEDCDPACIAVDPTMNAGNGGYPGPCAYDLGAPVARSGVADGQMPLDFWQAQVTFIKLIPQVLGGDTLTFVTEFIGVKVADMPGLGSDIFFEKPDFSDFNNRKRSHAEDFGWAYRMLIRNEYTNLFGTSWGVAPTFVWFHDVNGTPPANSGTFLEDRKQAILVLPFDWQNTYQVTFKYAWFGGAPQNNIYADRDTVSLTFSAAL